MTARDRNGRDELDLVVVGAGIAGMVAAATAARAGARVEVLDAHAPGGRARTAERDGYALNLGAHALYLDGALRRALRDLGIDPPGGRPPVAGSVGLLDGVAAPLPASAGSILRTPLLSGRSRLRFAALLGRPSRLRPPAGASVAEWLATEPDDVARVLGALVRVSTYTDAPEVLDAAAAATQLRLAAGGVRYVDGGWGRIIAALADVVRAHGGTVQPGTPVHAVGGGPRPTVVAADGERTAAAVLLAAGGPDVAERLTGLAVPGRDRLGPPVAAACRDLGLTARPRHPVAFGLDRPWYLSVHGPVAADLAPAGGTLVSLLRYLPPLGPSPSDEGVAAELDELARLGGVDEADVALRRDLRQATVHHGVPLAATGGLPARPAVDALDGAGAPGVLLAGDWVGATGMLADAAAASAVEAVGLARRRTRPGGRTVPSATAGGRATA